MSQWRRSNLFWGSLTLTVLRTTGHSFSDLHSISCRLRKRRTILSEIFLEVRSMSNHWLLSPSKAHVRLKMKIIVTNLMVRVTNNQIQTWRALSKLASTCFRIFRTKHLSTRTLNGFQTKTSSERSWTTSRRRRPGTTRGGCASSSWWSCATVRPNQWKLKTQFSIVSSRSFTTNYKTKANKRTHATVLTSKCSSFCSIILLRSCRLSSFVWRSPSSI